MLCHPLYNLFGLGIAAVYACVQGDERTRHLCRLLLVLDAHDAHVCDIVVA